MGPRDCSVIVKPGESKVPNKELSYMELYAVTDPRNLFGCSSYSQRPAADTGTWSRAKMLRMICGLPFARTNEDERTRLHSQIPGSCFLTPGPWCRHAQKPKASDLKPEPRCLSSEAASRKQRGAAKCFKPKPSQTQVDFNSRGHKAGRFKAETVA